MSRQEISGYGQSLWLRIKDETLLHKYIICLISATITFE
jgi:hypothetical protein